MKERFAQKIIDHFEGDLEGKTIAILGWAYKANTNDSRESAAIYIVKKLAQKGAYINIYDPLVSQKTIKNDLLTYEIKTSYLEIQNKLSDCLSQSDLIAIVTEHKEFKNLETNKVIFDGRGINKNAQYSIGR